MNKMKERKEIKNKHTQKGITLIALIITIVVLLILAVVAITAIRNEGIIGHAQNTTSTYNNSVSNEQGMLGSYEDFLNGAIAEPVEPKVGQYVKYNVSYEDMYSGIEYDNSSKEKCGWRYLGKEGNNHLIVSTTLPASLYYYYKPDTLPSWWATDAEAQAATGIYNTTKGWDGNDGYPNKYAAYGLRYKFTSIPFNYQERGTSVSKNTGIFRKVGNATSGTLTSTAFYDSKYINKIIDVHNLTLVELIRGGNSAKKNNEGFMDLTGDALGLFDLKDLTGNITGGSYWAIYPSHDIYIDVAGSVVNGTVLSNDGVNGVRPVIVLSSEIQFTDANGDEVLELH